MNKAALALIFTGAFLLLLTAGSYAKEAYSYETGHCGPADTNVQPDPPYHYQQVCCNYDYNDNQDIINLKCTIYKCYYGGTIFGANKCDVYIPGGKENAAPEPTGTKGAPPVSTANNASGNNFTGSGNDLTVTNDNPSVSDSTKKGSLDKSQLDKLIPIVPQNNTTTEQPQSKSNDHDNNEKATDSKSNDGNNNKEPEVEGNIDDKNN